jgi:hypothetical protein
LAAFSPALLGCAADAPAPTPQRPTQNAGAFTMMISPMDGTAVIVSKAAGVYYTGWSSAAQGSGASTVTLHTPQDQVSFVDANGVCHSNGGPSCNVSMTGPNKCMVCTTCNACNGLLPTTLPCGTRGTFCAPIAMVNNFGFALPDVVLQLANHATETRNSITSCSDSATLGGGRCASDPDNARKVDSMSSALTSPVSGCSYCYGNRSALTSANLGLRDAVLPNSQANNTDKLALNLSSDAQFGVDVLVEYPGPTINSVAIDDVGVSATCATINLTNVTVAGGGFGPQGSCTAVTCPVSGIPGSGYVMDFVSQTGMGGGQPFGAMANTTVWSDNTANATLGTTNLGSTSVARITTPSSGTSALSAPFTVCPAHGNLDHFALALLTPNPTANGLITFAVVAQDANGARVANEAGSVALTMMRNGSVYFSGQFVFSTPNSNPASYTWTMMDNGAHNFANGAQVGMPGAYHLTATLGPATGFVDFTVN